jgi:hypothetical protein
VRLVLKPWLNLKDSFLELVNNEWALGLMIELEKYRAPTVESLMSGNFQEKLCVLLNIESTLILSPESKIYDKFKQAIDGSLQNLSSLGDANSFDLSSFLQDFKMLSTNLRT